MSRASTPAEGRAVLAMMRDALVEAKMGLQETRAALEATRAQLELERRELETVRRRGRLAADIRDAETVAVAAQFERRHAERAQVLAQKLAAQESELELVEREVEEMTAQYKTMAMGADAAGPAASGAPTSAPGPDPDAALRRAVDRAAREADAERQLAELKRRMGK